LEVAVNGFKEIALRRTCGIFLGCLSLYFLTSLAQEAPQKERPELPPPAARKVDFQRDIQPIFSQNCYRCHGPALQMSSLRLDERKAALTGGNSGPVIQPGNSAASKLIQLVAAVEKGKVMPPEGERLTAEQVGLLRAWIDQGADWPEETAAPSQAQKSPQGQHWAFLPVREVKPPKVRNEKWVRNPIDAFVLSRLEAEKIQPSPEADRVTLIRRLSLDLTGLPPTPKEVADFVADPDKDAYEHLVERLLASPHYGEKWARQWLDLARYADSDGYEKDNVRPHAWQWRQWVIDALNRNLPFDRFTLEQVAGDLLPDATVEQKIATGFHRNTLTNREGGVDREEFRVEQVIDRTSTVGTVWLGLTVGCARCHDHKYDPISQREFYQLTAFFNTATEVNIEAPLPEELGTYLQGKPTYDKKRKALLAEYKVPELQPDWEKKSLEAAAHPGVDVPYDVAWDTVGKMLDGGQEILKLDPSQRTQKQQDGLTDHFINWYNLVIPKEKYEELKFKELQEKLQKLKEEYPGLSEAQTLAENPKPPKTHVLIRGDYRQPGIEVQPGTPAVLNPLPESSEPPRLRLARWLVSKDNPLTARVTVNRLWQEYFGRGLVETSQDFGRRGDPPTHPQLLDWLAGEFIRGGWDLKRVHQLVVSSSTYRQSSQVRKELQARDPYNKLLARQSRLRLPAELVRDEALAVSGLLNPTVGGKSVRPPLPAGVAELGYAGSVKWKESTGADRYRRGLYIFFQRTTPYPQLMTFDAPNSLLPCTRRERSTTPLQALNLLNDPVFFEAAQVLAARLLREERGTLGDRIDYAFRLCLGRAPRPEEKDRLINFYQKQKQMLNWDPTSINLLFAAKELEGINAAEVAAWVGVSRVLLNLEEFITRG
jgi:Protein of unknown function (DUF1553)/Protein of unknown function (DUF1549)/Planctomycete cytochrome C